MPVEQPYRPVTEADLRRYVEQRKKRKPKSRTILVYGKTTYDVGPKGKLTPVKS